jgi:hypothetical protein
MSSRRILLASALISSLLTAGCLKQVAKTLGDLVAVRNQLVKKFGEEVNVHVNETANFQILTVTFINSALNEKTQPERQKRAEETARIVKTTYVPIQSVRTIWVGFARQKTQLIVFHTSQVLDFYGFDKDAKPLPAPVEERDINLQTATTYNARDNESDIAANGLQLEGQPGKNGVTLLPHFKVTGDVRAEKSAPPKTVSFDFASYADKARFKDEVQISFIADGTPVVQTKGEFSGNNSQFCYLTVPYPAFKRIIAANELTIKVGDKEYALAPNQFAALQKMGEYVKD